jgi:hypothetical protein
MEATYATSSTTDDDDADDRRSAIDSQTARDIGSNDRSRTKAERGISGAITPMKPSAAPLLLKSRIHAGGTRVLHELGRGVPGFWGPPASEVAQLYAALLEVQS